MADPQYTFPCAFPATPGRYRSPAKSREESTWIVCLANPSTYPTVLAIIQKYRQHRFYTGRRPVDHTCCMHIRNLSESAIGNRLFPWVVLTCLRGITELHSSGLIGSIFV